MEKKQTTFIFLVILFLVRTGRRKKREKPERVFFRRAPEKARAPLMYIYRRSTYPVQTTDIWAQCFRYCY